jgi:trehalose 2-sulfotransferase
MHPHTSYLIYATPRSGSYLLCEALTNTGLAGRPTEYFGPLRAREQLQYWGNYAELFAWIIKVGTTPNGVFGGKMIWQYFEDFIDRLRDTSGYEKLAVPELMSTAFPNLRYVWITRRDKVRQAISYWKAIQTNIWTETQDAQSLTQALSNQEERRVNAEVETQNQQLAVKKSTFDFRVIDNLRQNMEQDDVQIQQYFTACGVQPFRVVYEDFVQTYEQTTLQILDYLQIPVPKNLVFGERKMKKQANEQSEEWIQRYYEIKHQEDAEARGIVACW